MESEHNLIPIKGSAVIGHGLFLTFVARVDFTSSIHKPAVFPLTPTARAMDQPFLDSSGTPRLARTLGNMGNLGRFALWAGFVYSSLCDSNYGTARRANNGRHTAYLFGRGHPAF
jgi:hypothetical protein